MDVKLLCANSAAPPAITQLRGTRMSYPSLVAAAQFVCPESLWTATRSRPQWLTSEVLTTP
jgi:hypothetical protein